MVDLDLEKFFDRVSRDKLMGRIGPQVSDQRMLKLIRSFLKAGVMEGGLVSPVDEGMAQGGPLSPLLSNIVLDELDREWEWGGEGSGLGGMRTTATSTSVAGERGNG